MGRISYKTTI